MMHRLVLLVFGLLGSFDCRYHVEGFIQPQHPAKHQVPSFALSASNDQGNESSSRRNLISLILGSTGIASAAMTWPNQAHAAPPMAVIAEELGYFPVTNKAGDVVYVPRRVQRTSSDQAVELAKKLSQAGAVMYGAFWCPHCSRQKELLGREAWQYITYVECSPKGFGAQPLICNKKDVDGYPAWIFKDKTVLGGERPLEDLAKKVNFAFQPDLEQNVPPPLGSSACKN